MTIDRSEAAIISDKETILLFVGGQTVPSDEYMEVGNDE